VGSPLVRLVIPLRVVEELDEKKYARRVDIADRARRLLPRSRPFLAPLARPVNCAKESPSRCPSTPDPGVVLLTPDEEVLDTCRELRQLTNRAVRLALHGYAIHHR
jgi:hypothetical protein